MAAKAALRCLCGGENFSRIFLYEAPPAGETRFPLPAGMSYRREVSRCGTCGHYRSAHSMDLSGLYGGGYVDATYGGDGLRKAFDKINDFPPEKSDNAGRARRVADFGARRFPGRRPRILDVGSGLCVFLHRLKGLGWDGTALDPDPRAAAHAREAAGVEAVCADFMKAGDLGAFDAVSFNKVLEHVEEPVPMLARAARHVTPGGFVYVELPDGEGAAEGGPGREEFFIEHFHAFSAASSVILADRAGFRVVELERLREPSGKYTLRLFLDKKERKS